MEAAVNQWLETLSRAISQQLWLAPLLALLAGVLSSLTPCALPCVPLVVGYVGGAGNKDTKRAFRLSAVFAAGMAVTFTALGAAAALLGRLMQGAGSWWYIVLGVLMVLMALQTWEVFNFIPSTYAIGKARRRGYIGALAAGMLGGLFSSPCATPVLVVLLAMVAGQADIALGILLLLLYSIGHSALVLAAGTSVGFAHRLMGKYGAFGQALKIVMGAAILLIGFYMFYLGF